MRNFINIIESYVKLDEVYSENNTHLRNYLKNAQFDPYTYWNEICSWLRENDEYLDDEIFQDRDDMEEENPELFYSLPLDVQKLCTSSVIDNLLTHDPADAPSWAHMDLRNNHLLARSTWLVHFTNDPYSIQSEGFKIGIDQVDKLGLTTYTKNDSYNKKNGGYNFAFIADSKEAGWESQKNGYGKSAVLFQNSGVHAFHFGDEENQIIFWGNDVAPKDIIVLTQEYGDWVVNSRYQHRNGSTTLFSGTFTDCVAWVKQNQAQYRRWL